MEMSIEDLQDSLRKLQQERHHLLRCLTREHELAIGTVSMIRRKCGNPNCHCAKGPGHPQVLFLFRDTNTGQRRCKYVRKDDESRMLRAGEHYREFRKALKRLRAIDKQEKQILMALAEKRAIHYE